jgi:hypothetical protein
MAFLTVTLKPLWKKRGSFQSQSLSCQLLTYTYRLAEIGRQPTVTYRRSPILCDAPVRAALRDAINPLSGNP